MRYRLWLLALPLLLLAGCTAPETVGDIDLSKIDGPTLGLMVLAFLAGTKGPLQGVAKLATGLLRSLKLLPPEGSPQDQTADELARVLADLYVRLRGDTVRQQQVLTLMQGLTAQEQQAPKPEPPANA